MPESQHDVVSEMLGAFVLHAVDHDEAAEIERHLEGCRRCRDEVDELREVATALGNLKEPVPPHLWGRIADGLSARPLYDDAPASAPEPTIPSNRLANDLRMTNFGGGARMGALDLGQEATTPTAWSKRGRHRVRMALVGAAAVVVIGVLGVGLVQADRRSSHLQGVIERGGVGTAVQSALSSPGRQLVDLRSPEGVAVAHVVLRRNGLGFFVSSHLPTLTGDETYQLWGNINGRAISLGLLGHQPVASTAFSVGPSVSSVKGLMITVEPAGGVVAPDRTPTASAALLT